MVKYQCFCFYGVLTHLKLLDAGAKSCAFTQGQQCMQHFSLGHLDTGSGC